MAVASSSPMTIIEGHLDHWQLGHYFKAVISGEHLARSKPAPDIFLLAAEKLGTAPAETLVLEDSYNGVRAGAAGGFVTVMVPDLSPATDEMRRLYTCECTSLHEAVSYTHLTLPTKRIVEISVVAGILKKKRREYRIQMKPYR